jgi:hypothetical protein
MCIPAYGVSKRSYGGKHRGLSQIPLHGIGQGNGAGPAIWAVISTILLNTLVEDNLAATFTSAISQTLLTIAAWCWVDDCDLLGTAIKPWERGEDCLDRAQQQMDHWEGLLTATGGGIVWEKSFLGAGGLSLCGLLLFLLCSFSDFICLARITIFGMNIKKHHISTKSINKASYLGLSITISPEEKRMIKS